MKTMSELWPLITKVADTGFDVGYSCGLDQSDAKIMQATEARDLAKMRLRDAIEELLLAVEGQS